MQSPRIRALSLGALLLATGCGTELGRASFDGAGTREVAVTVPAAGEIKLRTSGTFLRASDRSPYVGEWSLKVETLRGGVVKASRTCDPLDVSLEFSGSQSCDGRHANCSESYSGASIHDCTVALESGPSTLRLTLAPVKPNSVNARIKRLEMVAVR